MSNGTLSTTIPPHVVTIKLSGTVTADAIGDFTRRIIESLQQHDRIGILVDVTDWSDMTADAITADVKGELKLLPKLRRIPRIAIVSNKQWYNALVKWVRPMMFTTDIEVFDPSSPEAHSKAIAFASDVSGKKTLTGQPPSIVSLPTDRDDLLAFEYRGHLRSEDLDVIMMPLKEKMAQHEKIDLLVRMDHFSGFDPSIIFKGSMLSLKMATLKKLRRYAIVGAGDWISGAVKMFDPLIGIEMKTFEAERESEAWDWMRS